MKQIKIEDNKIKQSWMYTGFFITNKQEMNAIANILSEYLVALGFKVDQNGLDKFNNAVKTAGKTALGMASLLVTAGVGIVKMLDNAVKADNELEKTAKTLKKSKEEARAHTEALKIMGKTMDEIAKDPALKKRFDELNKQGLNMVLPGGDEALQTLKDTHKAFEDLRLTASYAMQWINHHVIKHLEGPLKNVKELINGLNDGAMKGISKWTEPIGKVIAGVGRLIINIIRIGTKVVDVIRRIPKEAAIGFGAFGAAIKLLAMGPVIWIVAAITSILLLLDDFMTYLDGGESKFGGFWGKLLEWIEKVRPGFEAIKQSFENIGSSLYSIFQSVGNLIKRMLGFDQAEDVLTWLAMEAFPAIAGGIETVIGWIEKGIKWFSEFEYAEDIIWAIIGAIIAFKSAFAAIGVATNIKKVIDGIKGVGSILTGLLSPTNLIVLAIAAIAFIAVRP